MNHSFSFIKRHTLRFTLSILLTMLLGSTQLNATHLAGQDLTYECLGNGVYEITLTLYRDCQGIPVAQGYNLTATAAACGASFTIPVAQVDTPEVISHPCYGQSTICTGGTLPGIEKYTYKGITTLGFSCGDWVVGYGSCCRNAAITTGPANQGLYVETLISTDSTLCNNSPVFSNDPVLYLCAGQTYNYNHGAIDPDGDSLVYSLVDPLQNPNVPVTFWPPFSATNPLSSSPPLSLDPNTGAIVINPTMTNQVAVMAVKVDEYRNGQLIGSVTRDLQIWVTTNCTNTLPVASGIDGYNFYTTYACVGDSVVFEIYGTDADSGQTVTMSHNNGIPGAYYGINQTYGILGFSWTPGSNDTGINTFTVTVTDDACPQNGSQTFTYNVVVGGGSIDAGMDTTICYGDSVQLSVTGSGTNFYNWSPSTGLSCTNCPNPIAYPLTTTHYVVTSFDSLQCISMDTVVVYVIPCNNPPTDCDSLNLSANFSSTSSSLTLDVTDLSTGSPITMIYWDFGDGSSTVYGLAGSSASHTYANSGTYNVCLTIATYLPGGLCCHDTICESITVIEDPCDAHNADFNIHYISPKSRLFTDITAPGSNSVIFDFGDGNTAVAGGGSSVSHTYATAGTYHVKMTSYYHPTPDTCCVDEKCRYVRVLFKKKSKSVGVIVHTFSNQGSGSLRVLTQIDDAQPGQVHQLNIYNASGQKIYSNAAAEASVDLDLGNVTPGVYMAEVIGEGFTQTEKFVIR